MKKKVLCCLFVLLMVLMVGCSKKEETKNEVTPSPTIIPTEKPTPISTPESINGQVEANKKLNLLRFYIPANDYKYRVDLKGLAYTEDEKKVFIKGDYENDPDNVITVIAYTSNVGKGAKQFTDDINAQLSKKDVLYTLKKNDHIIEIYARENYVIGNKTNYAYVLDKAGLVYIVNITGPKDKSDEINKLATDIHLSLLFS